MLTKVLFIRTTSHKPLWCYQKSELFSSRDLQSYFKISQMMNDAVVHEYTYLHGAERAASVGIDIAKVEERENLHIDRIYSKDERLGAVNNR